MADNPTLSFTNINEVRPLITDLFGSLWGSEEMVVSTGVYNINTLEGFVAHKGEDIVGIITYDVRDDIIEVVSLNSFEKEEGIGTSLMNEVKKIASKLKINTIQTITTNDNTDAQTFYEYLGFKKIKILREAVDNARSIKPSIPVLADNGVEIHDEILYQMTID
ncbi:GNAT family N-acetyltransferase [Lentilactobacillus sp. Marseille-Q4993]|uniref:GNAT family N-acetyltransferase n=1 Tax=Lentilactobacillus sp. Marseille-Q4993 TaxID=3039492 RepID=UPI0024BBFFC7|nr:GNAT family N-acetyltransferase [Lentilactobacillus sp. Marseille-Q4993]